MQLTLKPLLLDQIQFEKRLYCERKRSIELNIYLVKENSIQPNTKHYRSPLSILYLSLIMLLLIGAAFEFELFVRIMSTWLELFKLKKKRIKPDYVSKSLQAFEISFEKLKLHQALDNFPPSCFNTIFCYVKNILSLSLNIFCPTRSTKESFGNRKIE